MRRTTPPLIAAALVAAAIAVPTVASAVNAPQAEAVDASQSLVEDYTYPGAEAHFDKHKIRLLKGDGGIVFAPKCGSAANIFRVETLTGDFCFEIRRSDGFLTMELPKVFSAKGADRTVVATATHEGQTERTPVAPGARESLGGGNATHTLIKLETGAE